MLALVGCQTYNPVVDPKSVDNGDAYYRDQAECRAIAQQGAPNWKNTAKDTVVGGAVGVLAVAAGGHRKLAAPLFLGTGLLVVLVGYETLAITAALPTWTWLAAGGTVLLAAGVAMERRDLGPIETGKRLVDVVDEKFA